MQDKDANINVIRSVWRRTKKGHIKVRDLEPRKDAKGGFGPNLPAGQQMPQDPPTMPQGPPS